MRNWEKWGDWKCDSEGYRHRHRKCEPKDPKYECEINNCKGKNRETEKDVQGCCSEFHFILVYLRPLYLLFLYTTIDSVALALVDIDQLHNLFGI